MPKTIMSASIHNAEELREFLEEAETCGYDTGLINLANGEAARLVSIEEETLSDGPIVHNIRL